jgi:small subunit ribosomal protein S20
MSDILLGGYTLAQHKSAAKRARQAVKKNAVNTARKSVVRTAEKALASALKNKDVKAAQTLLSAYVSKIMKAAQKGVFSKATASRKVGRLTAQVQKTAGK